MALSRLAAQFAAEIANHDWSDAPYRADKAGHRRVMDGASRTAATLTPDEAEIVKLNVIWVIGQVLAYNDPNFSIHEFGEVAGALPRFLRNTDGRPSGTMTYGLRQEIDGRFHRPGTYEPDPA